MADFFDLGHIGDASLLGSVGCKLNVSDLQNSGSHTEEIELLLWHKADGIESVTQQLPFGAIIDTFDMFACALEVGVVIRRAGEQ